MAFLAARIRILRCIFPLAKSNEHRREKKQRGEKGKEKRNVSEAFSKKIRKFFERVPVKPRTVSFESKKSLATDKADQDPRLRRKANLSRNRTLVDEFSRLFGSDRASCGSLQKGVVTTAVNYLPINCHLPHKAKSFGISRDFTTNYHRYHETS